MTRPPWIAAGVVAIAALLVACQGSASHDRPHASPAQSRPTHPSSPSAMTLGGARWAGDPTGVHYAEFRGPAYRLRVVLAHDAVGGALETTSAMCGRTPGCIAGVNGDFFAHGEAVGAVVHGCAVLQTPQVPHEIVLLDRRRVATGLDWRGEVRLANRAVVTLADVNASVPDAGATVAYRAPYAAPTPAAADRTDYVFRIVAGGRAGSTAPLTLAFDHARRGGGTTVAGGQVVVSAPTGSPLDSVGPGAHAVLTLRARGGCDILGGHPRLLAGGRPIAPDPHDAAMLVPDARTAVGWKADGTLVVLTVDKGDGSPGATIPELARYLARRGVRDAINLDGGGSTTFVEGAHVLNRPSDGAERAVVNAVVVVRG